MPLDLSSGPLTCFVISLAGLVVQFRPGYLHLLDVSLYDCRTEDNHAMEWVGDDNGRDTRGACSNRQLGKPMRKMQVFQPYLSLAHH